MSYLSILMFKLKLGSASTKILFISLISYHENVLCLNSLISYHEFVKQVTTSCNLQPLLLLCSMDTRSKRPREEPSSSVPSNQNSKRDRTNTSNSDTSSSSTTGRARTGSTAHVKPTTAPASKARPAGNMRENTIPLDRACPMCSDSRGTIRHYHYSSTEI